MNISFSSVHHVYLAEILNNYVYMWCVRASSSQGVTVQSEPVLHGAGGASQLLADYERTIDTLRQTVAEQTVRISALEQKLGDPDELIAR